MNCPAKWDYGGFEPDRRWDGTPCALEAGHPGWHESARLPEVVNGRITWLAGR